MRIIRTLLISAVMVLLASCANTPQQEGGIGGTGHKEQCDEEKNTCSE